MTKPKSAKRRTFKKATNFEGKYSEGDYVEELQCTYGQACNMLNKKWKKFKIAKRNDDELSLEEAKTEINMIQNILGIRVTEWSDDYDKEVGFD